MLDKKKNAESNSEEKKISFQDFLKTVKWPTDLFKKLKKLS